MSGSTAIRRLAKVAAAYSLADGLIRGLGFILVPLLVTYLDTEDFGIFGALTALATLLTHLFGLGLSGAPIRFFPRLADDRARQSFLASTLLASGMLAATGTLILHAFVPSVIRWMDLDNDLTTVVRLTLWTGLFQVVARTLPLGTLRALDGAGRYVLVSAAAVAGTITLVWWRLVVREEGLVGVVRGTMEGAAITAATAILMILPDLRLAWDRSHVREAMRFGLPLTPHHVAHWALGLSDRFIVGAILGPVALGLYHFAYQFASIFQLLISAINSALLPRFARLDPAPNEGDLAGMRRLVLAYLTTVALIGSSIALLVPPVVRYAVAADYAEALPLVPWLVASVALFAAYSIPMNLLTMTFGRTERVAPVTLLAGGISIAVNFVLLPVAGLWGAVAATFLSYLVLYLGASWLARRYADLEQRIVPFRLLGRVVALGAGVVFASNAFAASSLIGEVVLNLALLLALIAGVAIVVQVPRKTGADE